MGFLPSPWPDCIRGVHLGSSGGWPCPASGRASLAGVHVIIMGCGRVGAAVTVALAKGGHSVAIIDKRAEAFEKLPPGFDARTIVGQGFDRTVLEEAGIREAEGF